MKVEVIVTRHAALVEYIREVGLAGSEVPVVPHAGADEVRGKHVVGVLPQRLAALCASVTEVPLDIPREMRGVELTLDQVRAMAGAPVTYVVRVVASPEDAELSEAYCALGREVREGYGIGRCPELDRVRSLEDARTSRLAWRRRCPGSS